MALQSLQKRLVAVSLLAGAAQVVAGIAMYLAGVYFQPWSMIVSLLVLLVCIVLGVRWCLPGGATLGQALTAGMAISVGTSVVYAAYNIVSISFFYPRFLDQLVASAVARATANGQPVESAASMRAGVSAAAIAGSNLIRLSIFGSVLSFISALFRKRTTQGTLAAANPAAIC